jgi:hypothetical protein
MAFDTMYHKVRVKICQLSLMGDLMNDLQQDMQACPDAALKNSVR